MSKEFDPYKRWEANPTSLRRSIDAKCWDCQGRDADPAPKWRIGNCTMPDCPLWNVRPYQSNHGTKMPNVLRCGGEQE